MSDWTWDLGRLNAGELSELRSSAGKVVSQADVSAIRAFYKACGYCEVWQESFLFPAVCMDALWRSTDAAIIKPMDECLRDMLSKERETTQSLQHRIDSLLETPWDDGGFFLGKMLNLVKLLKSNTQLKPDFQKLSMDLNRWNHPQRYVQRNWLRTIYNTKTEIINREEQTDAD